MEKLHNIVYKTTCLINNKIYIGVHCTDVLEDGYIGCGIFSNGMTNSKCQTYFQRAVKKHGYNNFKRELLHDVENSELAYFIEELLVDEEFLKRKDVYNTTLGGKGGWTEYNKNNPPWNKGKTGIYSDEYKLKISKTSKGRIPPNSLKILNISTNKEYRSITNAFEDTKISRHLIKKACEDFKTNKPSDWRYI